MLLAERRRRRARADDSDLHARAGKLLDGLHPKQRECVDDQSPQVGVLGTRRSGKSRSWIRRMLHDAATIPDCRQVYVNTTFTECERVVWRGNKRLDGLLGLNESLALGGKPNHTKLRMYFPASGSVIEIIPADNERAIQKLLGGAYHRVWVDEAQKMPHIQRLVEDVLGPAMIDYEGQVVMTGTPARSCNGYYYEITKRAGGIVDEAVDAKAEAWSVHVLNVLDNPFFGATVDERFARTIAKEMHNRGWKGGEPGLLREWYGKWVREDAMYAYDVHKVPEHELLYAPARMTPDGFFDLDAALADLPDGLGEWCYGMGCDLGYNPDPFALVIWAWSLRDPRLFELVSWKKTQLIPDAQGEIIQQVQVRLPMEFTVADADGAAGVVKGWEQGWQDRLPIMIQPAEKRQKETAREWFNNDVRKGLIKLREGGVLHGEMRMLPLRTLPNGKIVEDQRRDAEGRRKYPNDASDAALYGHRAAYHHRFVPEEPEPDPGTAEWHQKEAERLEQDVLDRLAEEEEFLSGF